MIRYPQVDRTQLFDLENDPHEATNLADRPKHTAKVAELTALMEQELRRSGDTGTLRVANPKPAAWSLPERNGRKNSRAE